MSAHKCGIVQGDKTRCAVSVPYNKLLCPKHWRKVPADLQRELYAAYKSGDKERHYRAMLDCMKAVNQLLREK